MYQQYKDRVEFLLVYIREAHPDSVLFVVNEEGKRELQKILQTLTLDERNDNAQICTKALHLSLPTVVDKDDNTINEAYAGWPDRMAIVDVDGVVAYYGKPGPGGFKPREVEQWLKVNVE